MNRKPVTSELQRSILFISCWLVFVGVSQASLLDRLNVWYTDGDGDSQFVQVYGRDSPFVSSRRIDVLAGTTVQFRIVRDSDPGTEFEYFVGGFNTGYSQTVSSEENPDERFGYADFPLYTASSGDQI